MQKQYIDFISILFSTGDRQDFASCRTIFHTIRVKVKVKRPLCFN